MSSKRDSSQRLLSYRYKWNGIVGWKQPVNYLENSRRLEWCFLYERSRMTDVMRNNQGKDYEKCGGELKKLGASAFKWKRLRCDVTGRVPTPASQRAGRCASICSSSPEMRHRKASLHPISAVGSGLAWREPTRNTREVRQPSFVSLLLTAL